MSDNTPSKTPRRLGGARRKQTELTESTDYSAASAERDAMMESVPLNVRSIPVRNIKINPRNQRKLEITPAMIRWLASQRPIDKAKLATDDGDYCEIYTEEAVRFLNSPKPATVPEAISATVERDEWEAIPEVLSEKAVKDLTAIIEFAFSLRSADRLLHPVVVWNEEFRFSLVVGERRYLTHLLLDEPQIYARVSDSSPEQVEESLLMWAENVDRKDLNVYEKVMAAKQVLQDRANLLELKDYLPASGAELAGILRVSRAAGFRYYAILSCNVEAFWKAIEEGKIESMHAAANLARQPKTVIEQRLSEKQPASKKAPVVRLSRSESYKPVQRLIDIAATHINDPDLKQELESLNFQRHKDVHKGLELIMSWLSKD